MLHILKGTDLADYYENPANAYEALTKEHYLELLIGCIERLSPDIVIHRLTGDGAKKDLIAPLWTGDKKRVLNTMNRIFEEENLFQGSARL